VDNSGFALIYSGIRKAGYWGRQMAKKTLFLLGAGISTTAGIPDYSEVTVRGDIDDFRRLRIAKLRTWAKEHAGILAKVGRATPTAAHIAVAEFVKRSRGKGVPAAVFTQNVDGLDEELFATKDKFESKIPVLSQAHGSLLRSRSLLGRRRVLRKSLVSFEHGCVRGYSRCYGAGVPDVVLLGMSVRLPMMLEQAADIFDELVCIGTTLSISWTNQLVRHFISQDKGITVFLRDRLNHLSDAERVEFVLGDIQDTVPTLV
jgi:NAD-dependent SIR2 family protein deacetylase